MNGSSSGVGTAAAAAASTSSSSSTSGARLSRLRSECSAQEGPAMPGVGRSLVPSASTSARPVLGALKQAQRQSAVLERALSSTPTSSARRGPTPFGFDGPSTPTPTCTYEAAARAAATLGPAGGAARRGGDVHPNNPFGGARYSVVELASNPFREPKQTQVYSTSTSLGATAVGNGRSSQPPTDPAPDAHADEPDGRCTENISAWQAGWNVTNAIQGMFLVSLPYAVLQGGWAALFSMVGVAYVCCYTGEILVECLYEQCAPNADVSSCPARARDGMRRASAGGLGAGQAASKTTNDDLNAHSNPFAASNNGGGSSGSNNPYRQRSSVRVCSPEPMPTTTTSEVTGEALVRVRHSYAEIAAAVWGARFGTLVVNAAQLLELLMTCILYLVLCGDLLGGVLEEYVPLGLTAWIVLGGLPIVPCALLTSLRRVSTLSFWCTVAHLVINAIIFAFCVLRVGDWELRAVQFFPSVWSFPIALGIIIFSYTSQIFLPTLEGNMSDTTHFRPMLRWSHGAAALCKTLFGLVGFITFKSATQEVITNNLPPAVKVAVNAALIAKALLSYPLPYFAAVQLIEQWLFLGRERGTRFASCFSPSGALTRRALLLRLALICATIACAVAIPHFAHLMGLIGSFTGTMLSFVWPAYFHLRLRWERLSRTRRALDLFIVALGLVAGAVGIFYSSVGLVQVEAAGHAAFTAAEPAHLDAPLPIPIYPKPPKAVRKAPFLRTLPQR